MAPLSRACLLNTPQKVQLFFSPTWATVSYDKKVKIDQLTFCKRARKDRTSTWSFLIKYQNYTNSFT
jgi:hypothetical protein